MPILIVLKIPWTLARFERGQRTNFLAAVLRQIWHCNTALFAHHARVPAHFAVKVNEAQGLSTARFS
jgi:hypothetical protein